MNLVGPKHVAVREGDVGACAVGEESGGDVVAAICAGEEDGSRGNVDAGADGRDVRGREEGVKVQRDAAGAGAEVKYAETAAGEDGDVGEEQREEV